MTTHEARLQVEKRVADILVLKDLGGAEAVGMALALLRYDLDDLEKAALAAGEAEGKRKAESACDVILAEAGLGHA
jgi:hypothetical protein